MTPFDRAVEFVLAEEGGYVNDPFDPGGEGNFGISKRSHPDLNIKDLTVDEAKAIYRAEYWEATRCDILPEGLAFIVFDTAVVHGPKSAIRLMQRALSVKEDGIFGPITLAAINKAAAHGLVTDILAEVVAQRNYQIALMPQLYRYGLGWYRRVSHGYQIAMELC